MSYIGKLTAREMTNFLLLTRNLCPPEKLFEVNKLGIKHDLQLILESAYACNLKEVTSSEKSMKEFFSAWKTDLKNKGLMSCPYIKESGINFLDVQKLFRVRLKFDESSEEVDDEYIEEMVNRLP